MAWLSGWKYRKEITVPDAFVDGNLTNFPTYIPIKADADFHEARADGHDIRFTLSDGTTLLEYEREHWAGGNGSPAIAHLWVKVPSILASGGAIIYVYYGKRDALDGEDAPNVWDANFKGAWHLKDITPSTVADSTGVNDGTKKAANEPIEADGKVYKGQEFDGVDDYVEVPDDLNLRFGTGDFSISLWAKIMAPINAWAGIIHKGNPSSVGGYQPAYSFSRQGLTDEFFFNAGNWADKASFGTLTQGQWYHLVGVVKDGVAKTYVDTVYKNQAPATDVDHSNPLMIGRGALGRVIGGIVDEVRISDIARVPAWLKFEHYNINEADNEITWGIEDAFPAKSSSSMRANFAGVRGMRAPFIKATRPSISTIPRRGYIK